MLLVSAFGLAIFPCQPRVKQELTLLKFLVKLHPGSVCHASSRENTYPPSRLFSNFGRQDGKMQRGERENNNYM